MERRVYRPTATMNTPLSFLDMMSQDFNERADDDIHISGTPPTFHSYNYDGSQGLASDEVPSQINFDSIHHRVRGRVRWSVSDTIVLIEAKRIEKDLYTTSGILKKTMTSTKKWKAIEKYCYDNGVVRSASQCRDRWEHVMPDYKKVRDYEKNIPSEHASYWAMTGRERVEKKLLMNFNEELYHGIDSNFGHDRSINPGNITVDTFATENNAFEEILTPQHSVEANDTTPSGLPHQSNNSSPDDMLNTSDNQCTEKKRKSMSKISCIKDVLSENNKMIISSLEVAEEGRGKRDAQKMDRDEQNTHKILSLEEKKFKHQQDSEQRMFIIEEQKIKVQQDLVSAINVIGEAMLKISDVLRK